jgi:hypothetical protein
MNDKEFILFLCKELWYVLSDGDETDLETIQKELKNRGIDPDEIFTY